jgi:hypothetical protein
MISLARSNTALGVPQWAERPGAEAPGPRPNQPRRANDRSLTRSTRRPVGAAPPLREKVAVAAWSTLIVSTQVERPEQSPDQPANRDLEPAVAVSVTVVPLA